MSLHDLGVKRIGAAAIAALGLLTLTAPVTALYVRMETVQVPVERLLANLERDRQAEPKNAERVINLARLHAMAFAVKSDVFPAVKLEPDKPERPWYGHEPTLVPPRTRPAPSPEQEIAAERHLKKAIEYYESALSLDPANLTARLGYGWTLDQDGQKPRAIAEYRRVIDQAWPTEQKISRVSLGQRFFTEEAAGYLVQLLDPKQDAAEIAELQSRRETLRRMPRPITPIAIPLEDDLPVSAIADPLARVRFDADGSGLQRQWSWITPDAGWLVYDASGNGAITSALQLFGSVTFWLFWGNGYEALGALDDNADGELTGTELQHLGIWHDRNRNGLSEAGEVRPLAEHGIIALSCRFVEGDGSRFAAFSESGARLSDGRTRPTYDVILRSTTPALTRR